MPEEEKKRHNMTFRLRSDLRAAIEEMAQENGRSLSEQLEYYVEAGFRDEAKMLYQYSSGGFTPAVSAFLSGRTVWKDRSHLPVRDTETGPVASSAAIGDEQRQTSKPAILPAWAQDPAERKSAIQMAHLFLEASRKGTIEALSMALGESVVEEMLAEDDEGRKQDIALLSKISEVRGRHLLLAEVDRLQAEVDALKAEVQRSTDVPSADDL